MILGTHQAVDRILGTLAHSTARREAWLFVLRTFRSTAAFS
jgi:hypothetical protein